MLQSGYNQLLFVHSRQTLASLNEQKVVCIQNSECA